MKKNVLVISPYNPFTPVLGASSKTLWYRIKNLSRISKVSLLTFSSSSEHERQRADDLNIEAYFVDPPELHREDESKIIRATQILYGRLIIFENIKRLVSGLAPEAVRLTTQIDFALIHIDDIIVAPIIRYLPENITKIIFFHNLLTLQYANVYKVKKFIMKKVLAYMEFFWIRRFETKALRDFSTAVVLTNHERQKARQMSPKTNIVQIPLEIDTEEYKAKDVTSEFPSIVFSGTMSYQPNHEAALFFLKKILPKVSDKYPMVKFYIVGKSPNQEIRQHSSNRVIVTGEVLSVQEFFLKSNVVVVPLLNGGGMRYKILEAFALSKAVVSTPIGAKGIKYTDGKNILIAENPDSFAAKICYLLTNRAKSEKLGKNARYLVENEYALDIIWSKWKALYDKMFMDR